MLASAIIDALQEIAPPHLAEEWDNVGLLIGDRSAQVNRVMLAIDYTADVAQEAEDAGCDFVIAYHPLIFDPLKRVLAGDLVHRAVRAGICLYSPHTALDVVTDGTNDVLAEAIGLVERTALRRMHATRPQLKLVTFVPEQYVEKVSSAMFDAGAGRIGDYRQCSFRIEGTGTFLGGEGTNPTVGEAGKLEKAREIRIETVVPMSAVDAVVQALYRVHPYEEPAFDLVKLDVPPGDIGMGRIGTLPETPIGQVLQRIREKLEVNHLLVAGPTEGVVSKAACCAGACGKIYQDALSQGARLYLTGELAHHHALACERAGVTLVCVLHSNSERAALKRLVELLRRRLPDLAMQISRQDRDPFRVL